MKTRMFRTYWLIPVLGIALVCGGYLAVKSYLGYTEQIASGERFDAALDRCWEVVGLVGPLAQAQGSRCEATARRLDELLSTRLATEWARVESADGQTQTLIEDLTKFIDRRRSASPPLAGGVPEGGSDYGSAGQMMLTEAH